MSIKKLVPWNWFRKEDETGRVLGIVRDEPAGSTRRESFTPFSALQKEINRVFNSFSGGLSGRDQFFNSPDLFLKPSLDISESNGEYSISIEVPGVDEKDISIELSGDTLIVSGEKNQESKTKDKNYYRVERSYGSFRRVLTLPQDADENSIKAMFKNGVLNITINKKALPEDDVKKISIN